MMVIGRQEGMTMWSIVALSLIGVFFLLLAFKLIPPYMDDLKVGSAIKRVAERPGAGARTVPELLESIGKMFDVEYISSSNLQKEILISPRGDNGKLIKLEYEVEVPILGNVSALLYFDHEYEAR